MNVYAINPELFKEEKLFCLLNILKIKQVISLIEECPLVLSPFLIFKVKYDSNYSEESINRNIQQAVYKFIAPICSLKYNQGRWNGEFQIYDLYKESRAYNPIYNLENCEEGNVLILSSSADNFLDYKKFVRYSLNILRKHAQDYHYENRICFVQFDETNYDSEYERTLLFNRTSLYCDGKFKSLVRYKPLVYNPKNGLKVGRSYSIYELPPLEYNASLLMKENGQYYDPLISYINIKSKEQYPIERGNSDVSDFFLGKEHLNRLFSIVMDEMREEANLYYHESDEIKAWGADSEMQYIRGNGGDWIDD